MTPARAGALEDSVTLSDEVLTAWHTVKGWIDESPHCRICAGRPRGVVHDETEVESYAAAGHDG